jgi:hypothetical protein
LQESLHPSQEHAGRLPLNLLPQRQHPGVNPELQRRLFLREALVM